MSNSLQIIQETRYRNYRIRHQSRDAPLPTAQIYTVQCLVRTNDVLYAQTHGGRAFYGRATSEDSDVSKSI